MSALHNLMQSLLSELAEAGGTFHWDRLWNIYLPQAPGHNALL